MAWNNVVGTGERYNAPRDGQPSTVGPQARTDHFYKEALMEAAKEQYFTQLADVRAMPKNFGKAIVQHHYLPLLDDRNINDQGIDATGAVVEDGNLYGSSKDVGTILDKIPTLSETGGRVNRVGFTRLLIEGSIEKFGFFREYTQESLDFDSDADLERHLTRETVAGASEISEAALQIDILNAASTVMYAGDATSTDEVTGEGDNPSLVNYKNLMRLETIMFDNRTPKHTEIITGTRYVDTRVVNSAMYMYVGSELASVLRNMEDNFGRPAFIGVEHYAAAGTLARGEIGTIGGFRVIQVPEMLHWAGAGAEATEENPGYRESNGKYNVYPMLVIGNKAFTTIGFQTDGKTVKSKIKHKRPNEPHDRLDPYGENGFMSIKWYYGFMPLRTERIAVIKTVAED